MKLLASRRSVTSSRFKSLSSITRIGSFIMLAGLGNPNPRFAQGCRATVAGHLLNIPIGRGQPIVAVVLHREPFRCEPARESPLSLRLHADARRPECRCIRRELNRE